MSGWDLQSLAKTALSTAQQKIDRALDIRDDAAGGSSFSNRTGIPPEDEDLYGTFGVAPHEFDPDDQQRGKSDDDSKSDSSRKAGLGEGLGWVGKWLTPQKDSQPADPEDPENAACTSSCEIDKPVQTIVDQPVKEPMIGNLFEDNDVTLMGIPSPGLSEMHFSAASLDLIPSVLQQNATAAIIADPDTEQTSAIAKNALENSADGWDSFVNSEIIEKTLAPVQEVSLAEEIEMCNRQLQPITVQTVQNADQEKEEPASEQARFSDDSHSHKSTEIDHAAVTPRRGAYESPGISFYAPPAFTDSHSPATPSPQTDEACTSNSDIEIVPGSPTNQKPQNNGGNNSCGTSVRSFQSSVVLLDWPSDRQTDGNFPRNDSVDLKDENVASGSEPTQSSYSIVTDANTTPGKDGASAKKIGSYSLHKKKKLSLESVDNFSQIESPNSTEAHSSLATSPQDNVTINLAGIVKEKQDDLSSVLASREQKLLQLSRANAALQEENNRIQSQLNDFDGVTMALEQLRDQYAKVKEERDIFRKKWDAVSKELDSGGQNLQQLQTILQEKEEQILELMQEGERLSKQELKHNNIIKKLRSKEKETEQQTAALRSKLSEIDALKQQLKDKSDQELKYDDVVYELRASVQSLEKQNGKLNMQLSDLDGKCNRLQSDKDAALKQISELHGALAKKDAEIEFSNAETLNSEVSNLREAKSCLEQGFAQERLQYEDRIKGLQLEISQMSGDTERKEKAWKWEIEQMRKKMESADARNMELFDGVSAATQPLLRQIEHLRSSSSAQQGNWEKLERALYDRLREAEKAAHNSKEQERSALEKCDAQQRQLDAQKQTIEKLTQECEKWRQVEEKLKARIVVLEECAARHQEDLNAEREIHRKFVAELNKEKELLSAQFDFEKNQIKTGFDGKLAQLQKSLDEKDEHIRQLRTSLADVQFCQERSQRRHSPTTYDEAGARKARLSATHEHDSNWNYPFSESTPNTVLENIRERLERRENELASLREELHGSNLERSQLASSAAAAKMNADQLREQLRQADELQTKLKELDAAHQALLQLYGEKLEQTEELRLDLDDLKQLVKQQCEELAVLRGSSAASK